MLNVKTYGESDADTTAEDHLRTILKGRTDVSYILLHPRVPINARPCRLPGSITVQAVLHNRTVVSVRQDKVGEPARAV